MTTLRIIVMTHYAYDVCPLCRMSQWEAINCKQITRWQHVSQLKAISFGSLQQKSLLLKMQQLILGTGTAIWWLTEPHLDGTAASVCHQVAARAPNMFCDFYLVKNNKIANNSTTT